MGNRGGQIHGPATRELGTRRWATRAWICCRLEFKSRQREVWARGYTELFFLDEVTAVAAGHRPCFECRRHDAIAFTEAVAVHDGLAERPRADSVDVRLHEERLEGRAKRTREHRFGSLPDGAFVLHADRPYAVRARELLLWSPEGYGSAVTRPATGAARVLTPPTALAALHGGFRPSWHETAETAGHSRRA